MKILLAPVLALTLLAPLSSQQAAQQAAQDANGGKDQPGSADSDLFIWGFMGGNSGCVIFKEYARTTRKFFGLGPKNKTFSGLQVIETFGYSMQQKKWVEDDDGLKELQRLSLRDGLTFVKLQENYSSATLEKARKICEKPSSAETPR